MTPEQPLDTPLPGSSQLLAEFQQSNAAGDSKKALSAIQQLLATGQGTTNLLLDAALLCSKTNQHKEAAEYYQQAIASGANSKTIFLNTAIALMESGQLQEAEHLLKTRFKKPKNDFSLHNTLGVILRRQGKFKEAIEAFQLALKVNGKSASPWVNLGNVYIDLKESQKAEKSYLRATQLAPKESENVRLLGRAQYLQAKYAKALISFRHSLLLQPTNLKAVHDLVRTLCQTEQIDEAINELDRRLKAFPNDPVLLMAKGDILKRTGRIDQAIALYESVARLHPQRVDVWMGLGLLHEPSNREKANICFLKAVERDNRSLHTLSRLCDSLNRSRYGQEATHIQNAYLVACEIAERYPTRLVECSDDLCSTFLRCVDYERLARLGSMKEKYDFWLKKGRITAFHLELSRVRTIDDRLEMVQYHRKWGKKVDELAAQRPLIRPSKTLRNKIRVGFMFSDLRSHPVSYFALPLLEHYDKNRFEVYCYSFNTHSEDNVQRHIAKSVDCFRWWPTKVDQEIAQGIANDQVDILFELGGATAMNRLQVMSYRPAPLQASWLGYPHSAGLSTIDYILVDPYIKPPDPRMLLEKPFEVAETWVSLGRIGFYDIAINPIIPESRNNFLTFGTMNNPYKYTAELLATWAKIMHGVPNSRFLFVRPEGDVPAFRQNIEKEFSRHGIAPERIRYIAIRGKHMPHYNEIDISLDTFPHVGGTTTCETLWMGVPVITLVGPAFFERLSYSNLSNAGLADLCAFTPEEYINKAILLAQDKAGREHLRVNLRRQLLENPLGQTERFAKNFYDKIEEILG